MPSGGVVLWWRFISIMHVHFNRLMMGKAWIGVFSADEYAWSLLE